MEYLSLLLVPLCVFLYYKKFLSPFVTECTDTLQQFTEHLMSDDFNLEVFTDLTSKFRRLTSVYISSPSHISIPLNIFLGQKQKQFLSFCENQNQLINEFSNLLTFKIEDNSKKLIFKDELDQKLLPFEDFQEKLREAEKSNFPKFFEIGSRIVNTYRDDLRLDIFEGNYKKFIKILDEIFNSFKFKYLKDENYQAVKEKYKKLVEKTGYSEPEIKNILNDFKSDLTEISKVEEEVMSVKENLEEQLKWYGEKERFFDSRSYNELTENLNEQPICTSSIKSSLLKEFYIDAFKSVVESFKSKREKYNKDYYPNELKKYKDFFDSGLGDYPLSKEQVKAVMSDESVNLINAAAGSGKTSVIASKVAHLIKNKRIPPSRILLLTFSKKASKEMNERVLKLAGVEVKAITLHGYGYEINKSATDTNPKIAFKDKNSNSDTNDKLFLNYIAGLIRKLAEDNVYIQKIVNFYRYYKDTETSLFDYKTYEEYSSQRKKVNDYFVTEFIPNRNDKHKVQGKSLETMAEGIFVRSKEEKIIADTLYMHGVKFKYEEKYPFDNGYEPDFFIPFDENEFEDESLSNQEGGIYLEHFSIDREGNVPPFYRSSYKGKTAKQIYNEGIEWKRELHKKFNTKLIETYSYDAREEKLELRLLEMLKECGVKVKPVNNVTLAQEKAEELASIISQAVNTFKLSNLKLEEVEKKLKDEESEIASLRSQILFDIFSYCLKNYKEYLSSNKLYDFSDLLIRGTEAVEKKAEALGAVYDYIIVDEFQDTSNLSMKFIDSLWKQDTKSRLFFVGDDWQSIYGFNGSDVTLMTSISDSYKFLNTETLSTNYRSTPKIVDLGQYFIKKNPMQTQKMTKAHFSGTSPDIAFLERDRFIHYLKEEISNTVSKYEIEKPSIMFLFRTNFDQKEWKEELSNIKFPDYYKIDFMTVHKSKGLEADFVFIIPSKVGFPIEKADDPFLQLMTVNRDRYLNSEERRVFYVAVTRAKMFLIFIDPEEYSLKRKNDKFWEEAKQLIKDKNLYSNISYYEEKLDSDQRNQLVRYIMDSDTRTLYDHFVLIDVNSLSYKWIKGEVDINGETRKIKMSKETGTFTFDDTGEFNPKQVYELIKQIYDCEYEEALVKMYEVIFK